MAALFALGVMSLVWMGLIGVLVALEKVGPWRRGARLATASVLLVLAGAILAAPHEVRAFVVPGSHGTGQMMTAFNAPRALPPAQR
jgi:predicted metal-binding membrane protein